MDRLDDRHALAHRIYAVSHLTGSFTLRSGVVSNEYFDKYMFESDPELLRAIAAACVPLLLAPPVVSAQQPNAQTAAAQIAANQQARKVQDLISRAESNYRSGVANYNSNHLDAARRLRGAMD